MKRKWLCGMLALPLLMGCVPASAAPGAGHGPVQQTAVRQIQQTEQMQQIRQTEALCDVLNSLYTWEEINEMQNGPQRG